MRILVKIEPDVRVAGLADIAADVPAALDLRRLRGRLRLPARGCRQERQ